jgi:SAM-dependent methyltransferase
MLPQPRWVLVLASFLVLYFELVFIRWIPGQVRVLGYFTNFVLIACFFGMGLGMILARSRTDLTRWAAAAIVVPVLLAILSKGLWILPSIQDSIFLQYEGTKGTSVALFPVLAVFYLAIAAAFVPLGQLIGRSFGGANPLFDYSANLLGSMAGIVVFFAYSWLALPAWAWFLLGMPLLLLLAPAQWFFRAKAALLAVAVTALVWHVDRDTIWSPYQKLDITPFGIDRETGALMPFEHGGKVEYLPASVGFNVRVNNVFYQFPVDLSDASVAKYPGLKALHAQYDLPFRLKPNAERVLIVGGGTGNDAAAALRSGARHIDVVDIDPEIVAIGRRGHPERPYDDPRVTVYVDDARHFFHGAEAGYDVIVFAMLDSIRLMSAMSSLRLDSYVYTLESFREARRLLKPDGIQVTGFSVGEPWMQTRFYEMLREVYGSEPIFVNEQLGTSGGMVFVSGPGREALGMKIKPRPRDTSAVLPSDDWPFVYARGQAISKEYLVALALVLLLSTLVLRWSTGQQGWPDAHFFCLGAGFLLLETKNVTTVALVFGSTWYVNSVVFLSVLVMALLSALLLAWTERIRIGWAYAGLFAAIALNFLVPLGSFADAAFAVRLALVGGLTALPMFFSGIVFAYSFKRAADPAAALGANVLGGVLGGVLEYLSLVFGLQFLFYLVAAFYALSLLALAQRKDATAPVSLPAVLAGAALPENLAKEA